MASSTSKKVIVYRFDRQPVEAIVNPAMYLQPDRVELMTLDGTLQNPAYEDLKALCFVSESGHPDLFQEYTLFERRPKVAGLWTRFYFRDGDRLDGILSHNLLEWPSMGYVMTPPHAGSTRQRVFIPRAALMATELRGVVGAASISRPKAKKAAAAPDRQLTIFEP